MTHEFSVTHHLVPFTFKLGWGERKNLKNTSEKVVCYFHRVSQCYYVQKKPRWFSRVELKYSACSASSPAMSCIRSC